MEESAMIASRRLLGGYEMRGKRLLATMMAMFLAVGCIPATAQAGVLEDIKEMPNTYANVALENWDCVKADELIAAEDLRVVIDAEVLDEPISIPVKAEMEDGEFTGLWYGEGTERLEDELMRKLAELQGDIDLELEEGIDAVTGKFTSVSLVEPRNEKSTFSLSDARKIISNVKATFGSFTVTVEGELGEHYGETADVFIITADVVKEIVEYVYEMFEEILGKEINSFSEIIEEMDRVMQEEFGMSLDDMLEDMELPAEELAMIRDAMENIDAIVDYFQSEEFSGILMSNVVLTCDCPVKEYYSITHQYFERTENGLKFIGEDYDFGPEEDSWGYVGNAGDTVYAKDYIDEEYEGDAYDYVGSYSEDYYWEVDAYTLKSFDEIEKYKADSLVLGGDNTEMILVYVNDVETSDDIEMGATDDTDDVDDEDTTVTESNDEAAPPTGDVNNSNLFLLTGCMAVLVIVGCVYYRKREDM